MKSIQITWIDPHRKVFICSPYDEKLLAGIKRLPKKMRRYCRQGWIVAIDDNFNGQPIHNYLRSLYTEAARRCGYVLVDETTDAGITQQKFKQQQASKLSRVLTYFPPKSLEVQRWLRGKKNFVVSLNEFLGKDLFAELQKVATNIGHRNNYKFEFEIPITIELMRILRKLETLRFELIEESQIKVDSRYPNGIIHFRRNGQLYIGYSIGEDLPVPLLSSMKRWAIAAIDRQFYWVDNPKELLDVLLRSKYRRLYMSAQPHCPGFGVVQPDSPEIQNISHIFRKIYLESWLWQEVLCRSTGTACRKLMRGGFDPLDYEHPFDAIAAQTHRFDWDEDQKKYVDASVTDITAYKQRLVKDAIASLAAKINADPILYGQSLTKDELLTWCDRHQVPVRKTWTKAKLLGQLKQNPKWIKALLARELGDQPMM